MLCAGSLVMRCAASAPERFGRGIGSSATFEVLEGGNASATLTERSCLPMYGTHTYTHTHTRTQRLSSPTLLYKRFHDRVAGAIVCCYKKKKLTGAVLFSRRFLFGRTDGMDLVCVRWKPKLAGKERLYLVNKVFPFFFRGRDFKEK